VSVKLLETDEGRKILVDNLLKLAVHHKETCYGAKCTISLSLVGVVYRDLVGRELTKTERGIFS